MTDDTAARTAAGPQVDLTSCDREPIHILGAVQPSGFLVALSSDWIVTRASRNVGDFLGVAHDAMLGAPLGDFITADALHEIRAGMALAHSGGGPERLFGLRLRNDGPAFDVAVHRSGSELVIEAEPGVAEDISSASVVRAMISRLQRTEGLRAFCEEATRQMRALTGFHRVMLYQFQPDDSGAVIAEARRSDLHSYLDLRFPASDIPAQARALYAKNWLRIVNDVDAANSPVEPALSPEGAPLDLSFSILRAVSPIHLEYLRNMGVTASMSVSIVRDGRLWGLFACHHMAPRALSFERRTAAELFGQTFSWILEAREREQEAAYEARARELHHQLMANMAAADEGVEMVGKFSEQLAQLIESDGVGVFIDGSIKLHGVTPTAEEFAGLIRMLNRASSGRSYATDRLSEVHPPADAYVERAAGVLAIPISRAPRDYLVFFRREVAQSVLWAGDPTKPATLGPNGVRLTPRKSFEAWREVVRGRCRPWNTADLRIADSLRTTLLEVILRISDAARDERRSSAQRQELLIAELNHRVRNILGLIQGLVSRTRGEVATCEEFAEVIGGRIQALARAHDQMTRADFAPGSLIELLRAEAEPYMGMRGDRFVLPDADVMLQPAALSTLALVFHELTTNAAKYGALGGQNGRVTVTWREEAGRLVVGWRESGGPAVQPPVRRGFGSTIIERSVPYELQGEARVEFALTGLVAEFVLPPSMFVQSPGAGRAPKTSPPAAGPATRGVLSGRAMVVEDNIVIAMEAEDMLRALGAQTVDVAGTVGDAMALIEAAVPDFALLDVNLGSETSTPVAERLMKLGVPFVFATGYGEQARLEGVFAETPVLAKPFTQEDLARVL
jgi:light-regulated signal transduction histidine kinase (bacteriophytochrome)